MSDALNIPLPPVEQRSVGMNAWFIKLVQAFNAQVVPTPTTATDPGVPGQFAYDANFIYICIAPNTWCRVAIATF